MNVSQEKIDIKIEIAIFFSKTESKLIKTQCKIKHAVDQKKQITFSKENWTFYITCWHTPSPPIHLCD